MIKFESIEKVYLFTDYKLYSKSISMITAIIRCEFKIAINSRNLFVFTCRSRKVLKVVLFNGTETYIVKKQIKSSLFPWPNNGVVKIISPACFYELLESVKYLKKQWFLENK